MANTLCVIAVLVGLGAMFRQMLEASGGADSLARALVARFGEKNAPWSLALTGFLVAIPVFFDIGFIILVPIVYGLIVRTGSSIISYGLPLLIGLATASLVASIAGDAELSQPKLALMVVAIIAGASIASHVNDSGFWLVNRYLGLTVPQTLRTWTVATTLLSLIGLVMTMLIGMFVT